MFYDRSEYDLVLNVDFEGPSDDYKPEKIHETLRAHGLHVGAHAKDGGFDTLATPGKMDDPFFVRDGKLWTGQGIRGEVKPGSISERYECDPDILDPSGSSQSKRAEAFNPEKCRPVDTASISTRRFKYGFAEINIHQMPRPKSGIAPWIQLAPFYDSVRGRWDQNMFANRNTAGKWPYGKSDPNGLNSHYWPEIPESSIGGDLRRFKIETHLVWQRIAVNGNDPERPMA